MVVRLSFAGLGGLFGALCALNCGLASIIRRFGCVN